MISAANLRLIDKLAPDLLTRGALGSDNLHHITPAEVERLMTAARREGRAQGERSARDFPRGEGG